MDRLKSITVVSLTFAAFIIFTSLLFYSHLKKLDRNYNKILTTRAKGFQKLGNISVLSNNNFFLIHQAYSTTDNETKDSLQAVWSKSVKKNNENIIKLSNSIDSKAPNNLYNDLIESRANYLKMCNIFFKLKSNSDQQAKTNFYVHTIQPCFIQYQKDLEGFSENYKMEIEKQSDAIISDINRKSLNFFFLGFSPLIFVLLYLLLSVLIILGFISYFSWGKTPDFLN